MRHRIARLVLVDALALFNGERTRDIVRRTTPVPPGLAYAPPRNEAEKGLFADLDPERAPGRSIAIPRIRPDAQKFP
jgi:hypothetical protein